MTLKEKREQWEASQEVLVELELHDGEGLLVVTESPSGIYQLLYYMPLGEGWEVSCDYRGDSLKDCMVALSIRMPLKHLESRIGVLTQED